MLVVVRVITIVAFVFVAVFVVVAFVRIAIGAVVAVVVGKNKQLVHIDGNGSHTVYTTRWVKAEEKYDFDSERATPTAHRRSAAN